MKNRVFLSYKYLFRNKKSIFSFILIGLVMSLSILVGTYNATAKNYLKNGIKENWKFKTLYVTPNSQYNNNQNYNIEQLEKVEHIEAVFKEYGYQNGMEIDTFKTNKLSGIVELYAATNKILPKIVDGTNFPNHDKNYMICPKNFYPNGSSNEIISLPRNSKFDFSNLIGKNITFTYPSLTNNSKYTMSYELVGLYENSLNIIDEGTCYVTSNSLNEIYLNQYDGEDGFNISDYNSYYIQVDNIENVEIVKNDLKELGYTVENVATISTSFFNDINKNTQVAVTIIYIISLLLLIIILFKQFKDEKKYYILLYYVGYKKRYIQDIYFFSCLFRIAISCIFSLLFSIFIKIGINIYLYFKPFAFNKWEVVIDYSVLGILVLAITVITILVSYFHSSKMSHNGDAL